VKIKDGATLQGLKLRMRPVLQAAERIWRNNGQELVVTSGTDGTHSAGSLHYYGYALDFRTRYFEEQDRYKVFKELSDDLRIKNRDYCVIWHPTHIHVEYRGILEE
jgi:hypothetical protein